MAMFSSVTVSIGEETKGDLKVIFLVSLVSNDTPEDAKLIKPGNTKKSLYVKPPKLLESIKVLTSKPSLDL